MDEALRHLLPEKISELGQVIGLDAALKLAAAWPGIRLFVPKQIEADHPIAVAIGFKAARELSKIYGGESITPPICQRYHRAAMKAQMMKEYRNGASASELARKYGVHQFTIYNGAAKEAESKQGSLLD